MLEARSNKAIQTNGNSVNGKTADIAITTHGSDWYWAVTAVMVVATFSFLGLALTKPRQNRVFHYITAGVTMVAAVAYFTMASNLGFTPIAVEFHRGERIVHGNYREIFYVRYIDWFITTPLLLMDLLLTAAMPWQTILWVVLVDWLMIVTGLVGALVTSSYKWGYFVFGCAALVFIVYMLAWEARRHAHAVGPLPGRAFTYCGSLTAFLWVLYPIAWAVCEGGNIISPDSEAVFYGILDVLAKPIFGALLIWGHKDIDPATLGLAFHDYTDSDHAVHEKRGHTAGATNGHTGVTNNHTGITNDNTGVTNSHAGILNDHTGVTNNHAGIVDANATNPTITPGSTATHDYSPSNPTGGMTNQTAHV